MNITTVQKQGRVPVTILQLEGKLDGSNYKQLVEKARELYRSGTSDLLIDLSKLTFLSSAGLAAIHQTALIICGQPIAEEETGWSSYHAIDRDRAGGHQVHVKLLSPQPAVADILDLASFDTLFEIHNDLEAALASF
jgi:anti-anti-sigma regulatory factor